MHTCCIKCIWENPFSFNDGLKLQDKGNVQPKRHAAKSSSHTRLSHHEGALLRFQWFVVDDLLWAHMWVLGNWLKKRQKKEECVFWIAQQFKHQSTSLHSSSQVTSTWMCRSSPAPPAGALKTPKDQISYTVKPHTHYITWPVLVTYSQFDYLQPSNKVISSCWNGWSNKTEKEANLKLTLCRRAVWAWLWDTGQWFLMKGNLQTNSFVTQTALAHYQSSWLLQFSPQHAETCITSWCDGANSTRRTRLWGDEMTWCLSRTISTKLHFLFAQRCSERGGSVGDLWESAAVDLSKGKAWGCRL